MGAVRLIYDETTNELKELGLFSKLDVDATRTAMQSNLRYCLQGNMFYLPKDQSIIDAEHRICWGRARFEEFEEHPWLAEFDTPLTVNPLEYHMRHTGIGFGAMYSKRHKETDEGRLAVSSFISQSIIDSIADNPEILEDLSNADFESLMAELFARRGFHVDLYRGSKDNGIDFLAVDNNEHDPIILCVQCKHPDKAKAGKVRRSLPVATVREIFGVGKAHDLQGCIAVTSSAYTSEAKKFAELKPKEISVADASDVLAWVQKYRWNKGE